MNPEAELDARDADIAGSGEADRAARLWRRWARPAASIVLPLAFEVGVLAAIGRGVVPFGLSLSTGTALAGLLVGLLVGLTGMGSGALMAPILILIVGVSPVTAVGTDLAYAALTKVVGGVQHARQRSVSLRVAGLLAAGSIPASLVSVRLIGRLGRDAAPGQVDAFVTQAIGVVLIIASLAVLLGAARDRRASTTSRKAAAGRQLSSRLFVLLGAVVGFLVGLTSVGAGSIVVAVLSLATPLSPWTIVGTDIVHGAGLTLVAGASHAVAGNVDSTLLINLLAGSLPGVLMGSRLSIHIPARPLKLILAAVLLVTGINLV